MENTEIGFTPPPDGIRDARWFAVDLHVPNRQFGFLHVDESILERSVFLDNRIEAPWEKATMINAELIPMSSLSTPKTAFLFHTSYCCSTLLARCLHLPPYGVALREPLLFRRLCDARLAGWDVGKLLPQALNLLARPWHEGGAVLLKPTHVAHNISEDLMRALPEVKGVVLTSTLEDFLLSNIKKTRDTQAKVPELIKRAFAALADAERFHGEALRPPSFLCAVALQWCAQQEGIGELLAATGEVRMRVLQQQDLLEDITSASLRAATWLGWPVPQELLKRQIANVSTRHAKSAARLFDANTRARETSMLRNQFNEPVRAAIAWAERVLFPLMRSAPTLEKSLLP